MSKRDGKMYLAMRLSKQFDTSIGVPLTLDIGQCAGCLLAFWTKKAAREFYGRDVQLTEIRVPESDQ